MTNPGATRPTPVQAIEHKRAAFSARLAERDDRFSQLFSKLAQHSAGVELRTISGLTEAEHAELESLRPDALARFQREIEEAIARLRGHLANGDPLAVLAHVRAKNLLAAHGGYFEPTHDGLESNVELVAGLLLTQPAPSTAKPPDDRTLQAINAELEALSLLSVLRNLCAPMGDDTATAEIRFTAALHWMTVRGTSYAHHGTELAQRVYRPLDQRCLKRYGFTVDDVLALGAAVDALSTRRMNQVLEHAFADADQVVADRLADGVEPGDTSLREALTFGEFVQRELVAGSTFTREDLADAGLEPERVDAVLRELSLSPGQLDADAYTSVFDKSPLVEHPFIELDGRFLLVIPGMVLRDTIELLQSRLMSAVPNFVHRRAKTLDVLAVEYLGTLLPGSAGYTNLFYGDYELDGLVVFDRVAVVVEGKANPLSTQAQRGDLVRLERDISRSVQEAWEQGARARDYLLADGDTVFHDEHGKELVRLPAGSVEEIVIVNPTLHQFAGHASQLPRLRRLGLFPDGEFPWSVFINDLRVIAETSDNAAVFLHYLSWRARLPLGERITVSDEVDLWACYLMSERFGALADNVHYTVGNSCTDFDAYYDGVLGNGPERPRPGKLLHAPVSEFVDRMAHERPVGWLGAAGLCLDLSIPELAFVCGAARRVWREANRARACVTEEIGRVQLVGVPKGLSVADAGDLGATDATLRIFLTGSKAKRGQILWAEQLKPITFELSDYEREMYARAAAAP